MIKVSFYKTTQDKLPKAFCILAEKCYHSGIGIFVYTNNKETTIELDRVLWTYSKKQFIPHGTIYDPHPEKHPILLGNELRNLNNSLSMLIVNADKEKILEVLSNPSQFDLLNCQRLLLLSEDNNTLSKEEIAGVLDKSSLKGFKLEAYTQNAAGEWSPQN